MNISEIGILEMDLGAMAISDFRYIHSYKMNIKEIGISEMDLGAMAISDFRYIHGYKYGHIGKRDIGNEFRCYGYIRFPINP
jgi:hypothetical protein